MQQNYDYWPPRMTNKPTDSASIHYIAHTVDSITHSHTNWQVREITIPGTHDIKIQPIGRYSYVRGFRTDQSYCSQWFYEEDDQEVFSFDAMQPHRLKRTVRTGCNIQEDHHLIIVIFHNIKARRALNTFLNTGDCGGALPKGLGTDLNSDKEVAGTQYTMAWAQKERRLLVQKYHKEPRGDTTRSSEF